MGVTSERTDHFRAANWLHQPNNSRISFPSPPASLPLAPSYHRREGPDPYWVNPDLFRTRIGPKVMKNRGRAFYPTSEVAGDNFYRVLALRPVP